MFPEKYARLEQGFQDQVECDRRKYEPGGGYLPNFTPSGPVDYILVAMEPSTGVHGGHEGQAPSLPRISPGLWRTSYSTTAPGNTSAAAGRPITLRISPRAACPSRMQNANVKRGIKDGITCCEMSLLCSKNLERHA